MAAGIEAALRYIVAADIAPLMFSAGAAIATAAFATAAIASPTGTTIFTGISTMGRPITIIPIIPTIGAAG
jgi:heme/copper-type cytochrome/quinol oxidase subunit 1